MNYFFALGLSPQAREAVYEVAQEWKHILTPNQNATWHDESDYHITLKFLGDLPTSVTPSLIAAALPIADATSPFDVAPVGTGMFPDAIHPRVLWVGVSPSTLLTKLAANIDGAFATIGYTPEVCSYRPHITIARYRFSVASEEWKTPSERSFPRWRVDHFALMQTIPQRERQKGAKERYNTVHTFPFGTPHSFTP